MFIINYIIDVFAKNTLLLKFISKNLSLGIFNKSVEKIYQETADSENNIYDLFMKGIKEQNIKLKNPEVTLYMIIELVSSSCFNSILYNDPLPINEFKPYLYDNIRILINNPNS